jgi:DNA replication protein DnaC
MQKIYKKGIKRQQLIYNMHNISYFLAMLQNSVHMSFFDHFKTSSPFVNAVITAFGMVLISYIVRTLQDYEFRGYGFPLVSLKYLLFKKNMVILEGKKSTYSSGYDKHIFSSSLYTDRFNAMWTYIIKNIASNASIYEIKEVPSPNGDTYYEAKGKDINDFQKDLFIVTQDREFLIDEKLKIYALAQIYSEDQDNKELSKEKTATKIDKITIKLFSYETDVARIKEFIDGVTEKYLKGIEDERFNKKFIYTLAKTKYEEQKYECWSECVFESSKTFDNLFFAGKTDIIYKLNFFVNNKEWYYKMGIPYTIGIGLHGPPGTGKTSLIKCVANMLNRHVINLSLKIIKTKRQLDEFFFEDRYNVANKKGSIGFSDKIIVIEDIDCIGDIVLKRETKKKSGSGGNIDLNTLTTKSNVNVGEVLKSIVDQKNEDELLKVCKAQTDEEPITLDDILNLWDGLRETPGRVLIISSNCYGDLDPALTRPGRIDITLELGNASHEIIAYLYKHLTGISIKEKLLKKIKPNFYSQAELINMFLSSNKNPEAFIERMLRNHK